MDLTLPLYRQLSGRLLLLILCFGLSSAAGIALYFYQSQELMALNSKQLPEINQHQQHQTILINHDRLIDTLIASKRAEAFPAGYQKLNENLKRLTRLSQENRKFFEQLSRRLQSQAENVIRLSDNDRRNNQLKDSVTTQLRIVIDEVSALTAKQTLRQNTLYQQINSDRLNDRVTAVRAKSLSVLSTNLSQNQQLHHLLVNTLMMFTKLDLQYHLTDFDYIQQSMSLGLEQWLTSTNKIANKSTDENTLQAQVLVLHALLFTEQNTLAKWRGQLHRIDDFRGELQAQKNALSAFLGKSLTPVELKPSLLEQQLQHWLDKANLTVAKKDYIWLVVAIFTLLALLFLTLIVNVRTTLRRLGKQSTAAVESYVETGRENNELPTQEMVEIFAHIKQVVRPKYSEDDYLNLVQQQQSHSLLMNQHSGYIFWQLPQILSSNQQLESLFELKSPISHWRHLFSRVDAHHIIAAAREAKTKQKMQRLSLNTSKGKALTLTIEYRANTWCGSVCLAEELQVLRNENTQLQHNIQQQRQAEKRNIITSSEYVSQIIRRALLQKQVLSVTNQAFDAIDYNALQALLNWCQQHKQSAQLRRDDFLLTLSSVNIIDVLDTVMSNTAFRQLENQNALYVNTDTRLNADVTIESELFQAMFAEICTTLLTKQQQVTLDVDVKVVDINSSQQTVRCSFMVQAPSCQSELLKSIDYLAQETEAENSKGAIEHHSDYLRDLMLVFNVDKKESQVLDHGAKFAFNMPLVLAEQSKSKRQKTKAEQTIAKNIASTLAKSNVLVVATSKCNRQRISQALEQSQATIETMQDLTLFQRQLSLKHLSENRLDMLVISPEVCGSDYDLIMQHLASLPEKLQPKVQLIQPLNTEKIAVTGLYSMCAAPWYESQLVSQLGELLVGEHKSNVLIESEIFGHNRFSSTQTQVLLAVAQPRQHQALWQLLHWFGLQVTLVSGLHSAEKQWQTGQYLVLISEFASINVEISHDIKCTRGVFLLQQPDHKSKNISSLPGVKSHWQKGVLPPALDIQALTKLLSTWLQPALKHAPSSIDKSSKQPTAAAENTRTNVTSEDLRKSVQPPAILANEQFNDTNATECFNLAQYVQNQGSVELAALMIDDYLRDIEQELQAYEQQINENNLPTALKCLQQISYLAEIIAAQPLSKQCRMSAAIFADVKGKNKLSLVQEEKIQQQLRLQLKQLKACFSQLSEYAELI